MITFTEEALLNATAEAALRLLPAAKLDALVKTAIQERVGRLTMEEACAVLRCKNTETLYRYCRANKIPIRHSSAKKRFILLRDIEAADERIALKAGPDGVTNQTTKIVSLAGGGVGLNLRKGAAE